MCACQKRVVEVSVTDSVTPPTSSGVDRAMLALAEAIIPGTSTIPAADDTTVREVAALIARLSPRLGTVWAAAHRALDAGARLRTGRPFHALSVARQQALLHRWERDPLFRTPLTLIADVYKIVHFDAPHVQRALGARSKPPIPVTEPRWAQQTHAAESWTGGDIECDVAVSEGGTRRDDGTTITFRIGTPLEAW